MPIYLDEIGEDSNKAHTIGYVAKIYGVSTTLVIKWFDSGKLKGFKIPGSRYRYVPHESLVKFSREHLGIEFLIDEVYYTTGKAAKICKLSQQTIIRNFDDGSIKGFRIPGSRFRRIPRRSLIEFTKEHGMYDYIKGNLGILE